MSERTAIHFGAGKIGRGFIGPLLAQSEYHVVFADVDKVLITDINERGTYNIHILDGENARQVPISDFSGVLSSNSDDIVHAIAKPDVHLITTSVGVRILPKIAPSLARGIQERRRANRRPINVIACENAVGATSQLQKATEEYLSEEDKAYVRENIGFANSSVDRIVPAYDAGPLDVGVERYSEWIVDKNALKGDFRCVHGMTLTDSLEAYVERKLFTLNTGHAVAAYLGLLHGHGTINEAMRNEAILRTVRGAMHESGAALRRKHPKFTAEDHARYVAKIEERFKNKYVSDDVRRVGREPLRKLSRTDRLVCPATMAVSHGLPIDNLARGIAAALLYANPEDEQALELQDKIRTQGVEKTITELTGFEEGGHHHRNILQAHRELGGIRKERL